MTQPPIWAKFRGKGPPGNWGCLTRAECCPLNRALLQFQHQMPLETFVREFLRS